MDPFTETFKLANQQDLIYYSSVQTQDVVLKTCQKQLTKEMNGKRKSRKSMLAAQHDDDIYIMKYYDIALHSSIQSTIFY